MFSYLEIPSHKLSSFEEKVKKLNRKADKYNISKIHYNVMETYDKELHDNGIKKYFEVSKIAIQYEKIGLNDWEFLGKLDHTIEGIALLKAVPEKHIPVKYYDADCICEHCNIKRYRTETFIFQNEISKEYKQVGRTCLKEFFGINPEKELKNLEYLFEIFSDSNGEFSYGSGIEHYMHDNETILQITLVLMRKYGYISSKIAQENGTQPTKGMIMDVLYPPNHPEPIEWARDIINRITEKDKELSTKIIDWANNTLTENNEFQHNVRVFLEKERVADRYIGFISALVPMYNKAHQEIKDTLNEYYGKEKDKVELELLVKSVQYIDGQYGVTTKILFNDKENRTFIWFASGSHNEYEIGIQYKIKGTIKEHKEYNNRKQTVLTRVKMIGE